jgi:hypothetical protein
MSTLIKLDTPNRSITDALCESNLVCISYIALCTHWKAK